MWTKLYNGRYIHGYCDKSQCRVDGLGEFKSLHAAKIGVTKANKRHDAKMMQAVKGGLI